MGMDFKNMEYVNGECFENLSGKYRKRPPGFSA
jgi:hypothetical protein